MRRVNDMSEHGTPLYPLGERQPDRVRTPGGMPVREITLDAVLSGSVRPEDVRIRPETLELQAQVAESAGRPQLARNLRRAAELCAVPDDRILEIYNALRPGRATAAQLEALAVTLEREYNALENARFVREAAATYARRDLLPAGELGTIPT